MLALRSTIVIVLVTVGIPAMIYFCLLGAMIMVPSLQAHAIYLHRVTLTWFNDLNVPEQFGFAHRQVTTFNVTTEDGIMLHAWHILPLNVYRRNYDKLALERPKSGKENITETRNFRLLRDDPEARLVIYMHGTSGTMASGWRPDSYRALYSAAPDKIHVLTFDYRGYGLSTGTPTELGLLTDAITVYNWATHIAGVSPERIVIFGQSLGSAVAIALADYLASQSPPVSCAGMVITSSFSDIVTLTATYRIGGVIPVLSPVAKIRPLFDYFVRHLQSTWLNTGRIQNLIRNSKRFYINFVHAEDDPDIPFTHTETLVRHAIEAAGPATNNTASGSSKNTPREQIENEIEEKKTQLGQGGWFMEWPTEKGTIRQDFLKYGVHDKVMAYPVVAFAVLRAFQSTDPDFAAV